MISSFNPTVDNPIPRPYKEFENLETLLIVELREVGPDLTELTLKHERLPSTAYRDSVQGGWTGCLDNLEALLAEDRVAPSR